MGPESRNHQKLDFLNRKAEWTNDAILYQTDDKHVQLIISDLGLEKASAVSTPMTSADLRDLAKVLDEEGQIDESERMNEVDASSYRSIVARMNYLALDRSDLQQGCRHVCSFMSRPLEGCWQLAKRVGRYLVGKPRVIQRFVFTSARDKLVGYSDSD